MLRDFPASRLPPSSARGDSINMSFVARIATEAPSRGRHSADRCPTRSTRRPSPNARANDHRLATDGHRPPSRGRVSTTHIEPTAHALVDRRAPAALTHMSTLRARFSDATTTMTTTQLDRALTRRHPSWKLAFSSVDIRMFSSFSECCDATLPPQSNRVDTITYPRWGTHRFRPFQTAVKCANGSMMRRFTGKVRRRYYECTWRNKSDIIILSGAEVNVVKFASGNNKRLAMIYEFGVKLRRLRHPNAARLHAVLRRHATCYIAHSVNV